MLLLMLLQFTARLLLFALGVWIVVLTLRSAVQTFVLPRSAPDRLTGFVFRNIRWLFEKRLRHLAEYERRDALMAMYAPVGLLMLLPSWLTLILLGYTAMFRATDAAPLSLSGWYHSVILSGSSLFTLGFARSDQPAHMVLTFTEATIGLILVALLLAYLPTMYGAFSTRERAVTMLEVRAGSPPTAVEMIWRFHRLRQLADMHDMWEEWEGWFAEIQESHTSLAALVFFRSPQARHSWLTSAGTVLDTAALMAAAVDVPRDVQRDLCIRAGYLALRNIADFFSISYPADPHWPEDSISILREEFDEACDRLTAAGVPMLPDREQAWQHFAGWRVNYDRVLLALARLTMAPPAPWTSDRSPLDLPR